MRWFFLLPLAIACMVGVILLVVYIMGSRLPVAHRATRMVRLSESPDVVFAAITGAQDWRNVVKTDLPADGSSGKLRGGGGSSRGGIRLFLRRWRTIGRGFLRRGLRIRTCRLEGRGLMRFRQRRRGALAGLRRMGRFTVRCFGL